MRTAKEFRDQSMDELNVLYRDLSKEIYFLNNEVRRTRKLEKPHLIRHKKRDRARVLTVIHEKKGSV